ncbi:MAG: hypothetical protein MZV70_29320 [Desulfobacterales bacterium]|nr:hypothetical protein [Desulfobacterales bacterium]
MRRQAVDVRSLDDGVAHAPQGVPALVVGQDQQDVRTLGIRCPRRIAGARPAFSRSRRRHVLFAVILPSLYGNLVHMRLGLILLCCYPCVSSVRARPRSPCTVLTRRARRFREPRSRGKTR